MSGRFRRNAPLAADAGLKVGGAQHLAHSIDVLVQSETPGTLYIVSTPIGNPQDITLRAIEILRSVSVVAAENCGVTRTLLQFHGIETPIISFRSRGGGEAVSGLVDRLKSGDSLALVSDAGTPILADAGNKLVRAAISCGAPVTAAPGPSAALAALVLSGSGADKRFVFDGFPPRGRSDRSAYFASLSRETRTVILYETRLYLHDTLSRLTNAIGGERTLLVARNLTKPSETLFHGSFAEAVTLFRDPPSGEYTLVVSSIPVPQAKHPASPASNSG